MFPDLLRVVPVLGNLFEVIEPLKPGKAEAPAPLDRFLAPGVPDTALPHSAKPDDVEKDGLKKLEFWLQQNRPASSEQELEQFSIVEHLARQYLHQDRIDLAAATFELLGKIAAGSPHEEVFQRRRLYDGYRLLIEDEEVGAREAFEEVGDLAEAASVLETIDAVEKTRVERGAHDRRRMLALGLLDVWGAYADEGEAYEFDQAKGVLGVTLGVFRYYLEGDQRTMLDRVAAKWNLDRDLIRVIRAKIQADEAGSVQEALTQIGEGKFHARAQQLLAQGEKRDSHGSYFLGHLIRYFGEDQDDPKLLRSLMEDADNLESRMQAVQTPYAVYSFLSATERDEKVQADCASRLEALERGKGVAGMVWDMIRTTGTDDLVQIATMSAASKLGNLSRLAALSRLNKSGITGYKALALAYGAGIGVEGTALWAMNTVHQSLLHDVGQVYQGKNLLKSWGASLLMIAGLKGIGGISAKYAPRVAELLSFTKQESATALAWGLGHLLTISGSVATNQINQALGWSATPKGGFKESLVHEVFNYLKYGIAQKGVARWSGLPTPTPAKSSPPRNIYRHPLLSPLWAVMGVDGMGFGGGRAEVKRENPISWEIKLKINEFLWDCRGRNLPSRDHLDIEDALEMRIRMPLGLEGTPGGNVFADLHSQRLEWALSDPQRAPNVRRILDMEITADQRLFFQKRWEAELNRSGVSGVLDKLGEMRRESHAAYARSLETVVLLIEHLRWGPVPESPPPSAP